MSTSFHRKNELLHLVDLDLNPPFKHAGLVSVRLPVRPGKLNKTRITGTRNTVGPQRLSAGKKLRIVH